MKLKLLLLFPLRRGALLLLLAVVLAGFPLHALFAQNTSHIVTGTVQDGQDNSILPGVNVLLKGTTTGTSTDGDGKFALTVSDDDAVLVVSFIGYETLEIPVAGRNVVDVMLMPDIQQLMEVVVVGYGTMEKKDLTGSVIQVDPSKFENDNPKTIQDVLRGTPGLNVGYNADAKGGGSMQIRGQNSVGTSSDPLIILNGMIFYGELSEINPDDIDKIDILKDASATAVYGAQAANGVVIITTKKGKMGKPTVKFNSAIGVTQKSAYRGVYGPEGYLNYRKDWYETKTYGQNATTGEYGAYESSSVAGMPGYYARPSQLDALGVSLADWRNYSAATNGADESDESIWGKRVELDNTTLENFLAGKTFDWYDHTFRLGFNQDYNLSVSGASDRINYYMSLGYIRNEGAIPGDNYRAVRSNVNVNGKVNDWLEVGTTINFQDRTDGGITPGLGTSYWSANQLWNSPFSNYRDEDGNLEVHPMGDNADSKGYNYDFNKQYIDRESGYTVLNTVLTAKVTLPFNITYTFNAAPRYQFYYYRYFESAEHPDWLAENVGVARQQAKRFDWSLNNTLNWDEVFGGVHHFNVTLVQEAEERRYWEDYIYAGNIQPSDALSFHNTANATMENSSFSSYDSHITADALLARVFYSLKNRYMITATVRRDGYSAFGSSNPYGTFPSVGLGWSFIDENFFNWPAMSQGKLRVSWGKNGNRALSDPYISLANLGAGTGATQGYVDGSGNTVEVNYLLISRLANTHLQWEKTESINAGLDFGFLNDRISGSVDLYNKITHDMIMSKQIPGFSGFSTIATNLGRVRNRGIEIKLNTVNVQKSNWEWRSTFGLAYYQNKIIHLYGEYEDVVDANGNVVGSKESDDISNGWFIGKPISAIWDYKVTGIWQKDEAEEAAEYGQEPGDPKVANRYTADDDNTDATPHVYNNSDKVFMGQTAPPLHWSLRNDFTIFKNFTFSFNMYSYMGHKSLSGNYLNQDNGGSLITNGMNTFKEPYWTVDHPTNSYARLDAAGPDGITPYKLYDRSFIRLENISCGYTLPGQLAGRLDMQQVKVYATIRNVAVWNKDWEYGDPETGGLATRIYSLGLSATF